MLLTFCSFSVTAYHGYQLKKTVTNISFNYSAKDVLMVLLYTKTTIMARQSISFTEPNDEWLKTQVDNKALFCFPHR